MLERYLARICFDPLFGRQMRFIAGPRQIGKTTLAKAYLKSKHCESHYYDWDKRIIRRQFKEDPYFFHSTSLKEKNTQQKIAICFDEIHKYPKWKNILKDYFDSFENQYEFIITGSARLDLFRKSGDPLSGRFFLFRLLPISLFELSGEKLTLPTDSPQIFIEKSLKSKNYQNEFQQLLKFGGFPEPFMKANEVFSSNWRDEYIETLIREDLRDLTKIQDLENIATLMKLLPERMGTPLSMNALSQDLEVSYNANKNYLKALHLTYVLFSIAPYSKKVHRSIKKEKKVYFYDWALHLDPSKQFENYIACELKHRIEIWTKQTKYKFDLFYVRTRDKKEIDFLITRDAIPYLLIESKLSETSIDSHAFQIAHQLGQVPIIQLLHRPNVLKRSKDNRSYVISAPLFLG